MIETSCSLRAVGALTSIRGQHHLLSLTTTACLPVTLLFTYEAFGDIPQSTSTDFLLEMTKNPRLRKATSTPNIIQAPMATDKDNKESSFTYVESRELPSLKEMKDMLNAIGRPQLQPEPPEFGRTSLEIRLQPQSPRPATWAKRWSTKRVSFDSPLVNDSPIVKEEEQDPELVQEEPGESLLLPEVPTHALEPMIDKDAKRDAGFYCRPFCDFISNNPTIFHTIDFLAGELKAAGFKKVSERVPWKLERGGKYFVERNGSSMIAFAVGEAYEPGNGVAMIAGHIDALCAKLKPISNLRTNAGYVQLGVAPYAGAPNNTWWDRDLGIGGRVLIKESSGKIVTKLVKLPYPIARIPTLAPHFGAPAYGPFNLETQMVPIIGLDNSESSFSTTGASESDYNAASVLGGAGSFASTQPPRLVKAIAGELRITDFSTIVNWELELFDTQPAQTGGLDHEFIFAGRIDDKICSWAAMQALINSTSSTTSYVKDSGIIQLVGVFDDEEIGSLLRQGARGNFLPGTVERIVDSFASPYSPSLISRTYANSFLLSSDVTHAVNPNFLGVYLPQHAPRLNTGIAIVADSNGHMTTDSISTAILQRCADKCGQKLQVFQIRNDSRSGGTVGPMLSAAMGVRAIDAGIPQLSMHSIRATVGSLDPGLGVLMFQGFLEHFESVDKEFKE